MRRFLGVGRAHLTIQQSAGKVTDPTRVSTVTAQWTIGPRTAAWDELWRRIFAHVLYDNEDETNDAAQELDEPVDVNTPE